MEPQSLLVLLVRRRMQAFGRRLARRFRDVVDVEDIMSVVDLALLRAARQFDVSKGPFPPFAAIWVRREVLQLVRRELRWRRRTVQQPELVEEVASEHPHDEVERRNDARILDGDIDVLWRAHVGYGESLRDIANTYGLTLRQVQGRIAKALVRLRKLHAPWMLDPWPARRVARSQRRTGLARTAVLTSPARGLASRPRRSPADPDQPGGVPPRRRS